MRTSILFALLTGLLCAVPLHAAEGPIARLPAVQDPPADPDAKAMFDNARSRGSAILNLSLIRAHAPKLARPSQAVAYAIRFNTVLPRSLIELAIMRTAQIMNADYEINQHRPMMVGCGYTPGQLASLASWRSGSLFDEKQRAVLAYVEQAVPSGNVDDATFAELVRLFTPQEIVELTMTIGNYVGTAIFVKALKIKPEDDGRLTVQGKC